MIATRPTDARPYVQRARRWSRDNLFSSKGNTVLTVVTVVVVATLVLSVGRFIFISADWTVIETNRRLLFLGRTPLGEEWRFWPPIWALLGSGWFAFGLWLRVDAKGYAIIAGVLAFMFLPHPLQLVEDENALLLLVGVALGAVGYVAARRLPAGSAYRGQAQVGAVIAVALLLPLMIVMLRIDGGVRTTLWSGVMLNVMLATVGIAFGFPMGVLLALARASSYPVIRWTATGYIEVVRAAPLVAWLFIARFVLPDFLPPVGGLDDLDLVIRAMLVLAGFSGAYIAEIVRGGLQSVDRGQAEASQALGLNAFYTSGWIVLPQALRAVIPALVSQFISLWKDTTLIFALGLTELLGAGEATLSQVEFIGREKEVLAFVALLFWAVAFGMSRLSVRIEQGIGIGQR